jgi:hypothetical protein
VFEGVSSSAECVVHRQSVSLFGSEYSMQPCSPHTERPLQPPDRGRRQGAPAARRQGDLLHTELTSEMQKLMMSPHTERLPQPADVEVPAAGRRKGYRSPQTEKLPLPAGTEDPAARRRRIPQRGPVACSLL